MKHNIVAINEAQASQQVEPEFLSISNALQFSGGLMSRTTLWRLIRDGKIKGHMLRATGNCKGRVAVSLGSLRAYLNGGVK